MRELWALILSLFGVAPSPPDASLAIKVDVAAAAAYEAEVGPPVVHAPAPPSVAAPEPEKPAEKPAEKPPAKKASPPQPTHELHLYNGRWYWVPRPAQPQKTVPTKPLSFQ